MKKNYIQPATESVLVGTKKVVMLGLSGNPAKSDTSVLSKERAIIDFSKSYNLDDED